jgi:hypothetical protein
MDIVYRQSQDVHFPADATAHSPDDLAMWMGVYSRVGRGQRLRPQTEHKTFLRAVRLP